jgi:hypothetical protein
VTVKTKRPQRDVRRGSKSLAIALYGCSMLALAGCGMENPILSSGPDPRVEDCFMIGSGTPARFACSPDGKVYTSTQLADIRMGKPIAAK